MSVFYSVQPESFKLHISQKDGISHNGTFDSTHIDLFACRNSFAAFQILLQGTKRLCAGIGEEPWFSEYLDTHVVHLRHKGQLDPVVNLMAIYKDNDGTEYADRLMRDTVATTPAGVPQGVFVRFELPETVNPGHYVGSFDIVESHLFDDEKVIGEITYSLEVSPYVLPAVQNWSVEMDLWQHNSSIAKQAAVPHWSDAHFALMEEYIKPLADLGQTNITVIATQVPWSGQTCFLEPVPNNMFQYSMIPVEKTETGFVYDYSIMDRYIEMCFRYGIDRKIEVFGLIGNWVNEEHGFGNYTQMPEAIRIRYKDMDGCYRYMRKAEDIQDYIRSLHDHFVEKDWIDKVRVIADEPSNHAALRGTLEVIRSIAPQFQFKAAFYKKEFFDEFKDIIRDFCIIIPGIGLAMEQWQKIFREDREHCFTCYVCCWPMMPNIVLNSGLLEARYIPVFASYFGLAGFLRWNYTVWTADPRKDITYSKWPAGDTNMVYPAPDATPELALRYFALRRGLEDYELLQLLEKQDNGAVAKKLYDKVLHNRDVSTFYNQHGEVMIPFHKISLATQDDYDTFRKEACATLVRRKENV